MVDEVIALMESRLRETRIALRADLAPSLPAVFGDRILLQQVVLNLTVNAIDAVTAKSAAGGEIRVRSFGSRSSEVSVALEDSGVGLQLADLDHIFDPFRSTKRDGMGIGLSICRSIIEAHGGRIRCGPGELGGAVFQFTLPAGDEDDR